MLISFFHRRHHRLWDNTTASDWKKTDASWIIGPDEQRCYKHTLHSIKPNHTVALLGATPKIRNILKTKKCQVHIIDRSQNMYQQMSTLSKSNPNEQFIQSDWIDHFKKSSHTYNTVIGDLPVRLLNDRQLKKLFNHIYHRLTPQGQLILRMHTIPKTIPSIDNIIRTYTDPDAIFFPLSLHGPTHHHQLNLKKWYQQLHKYTNNSTVRTFLDKWPSIPLPPIYIRSIEDIPYQRYFQLTSKDAIETNPYPHIHIYTFTKRS